MSLSQELIVINSNQVIRRDIEKRFNETLKIDLTISDIPEIFQKDSDD